MTKTQPSGGQAHPDDETMLAELDRMIDDFDPPPPGLVERIQFAIALEDLHVEVARWEHGDALAGVRGGDPGTITFTVNDLTVMINLTRIGENNRIDGWLVPAGEHSVEVRVAEFGSRATTSDEGGRFVLDAVPRGTTQIIVQLDGPPARTVVTPTVLL